MRLPRTIMMSDAQDAASDISPCPSSDSSQEADSLFSKDLPGEPPLFLAARRGDAQRVKLLLTQSDADLNAATVDGKTPLTYAARNGLDEIVELMLQHKDEIDPENYQRAFFAAAQRGEFIVLELLLAAFEIDVNAADAGSCTALHLAAGNNHAGVVDTLLKTKAIDINRKDRSDLTALDRAIARGHKRVVELLLPRTDLAVGADLEKAIQEAARNGHDDLLDSLLDTQCASVGYVLDPLSWSACRGHNELLQILLSRDGADVNAVSRSGRTPLSWAAQCGRAAAVELLLRHGADANTTDRYGYTPLWLAIREKEEEAAKKLIPVDTITLRTLVVDEALEELKFMLRFKPNLEQRDHYGQTALQIAAQLGVFDIAEALMSAGADVDVEDNVGMTPLRTALLYRYTDLIRELLKRRANTTGIMSQEWRRLSDEGDLVLLSEAFDGEQRLDFPERDCDIRSFVKGNPHMESFLLLMPDETNTSAWTKVSSAVSDNKDLTINDLQVDLEGPYKIPSSIAMWLPLDQFSSDRLSGCRRGEVSRIMWSREFLPGGLKQMMYLSTLPYGCVPGNHVDLFHQFLAHAETQWLELCRRAGECLSQRRFDQLRSQGKSPETMNDLAKYAQKLAGLRLSLGGQMSEAKKTMDHGFMENASSDSRKKLLKFLEEDFEPGIKKRLDELDQIARDLLQIEFAWSSIHEARYSTKLGQNVMLLTYVSIFYLPLGFCAALWAIPNITDIGTRLPFILTALIVSLLTLMVTFNMERIAAWLQKGYQGSKRITPSDLSRNLPSDLLKAPRGLLGRILPRREKKKTQDPSHP